MSIWEFILYSLLSFISNANLKCKSHLRIDISLIQKKDKLFTSLNIFYTHHLWNYFLLLSTLFIPNRIFSPLCLLCSFPTSICLHLSYPQECPGPSSLIMSASFKVTPISRTVSVFLLIILSQEYLEDF